MPRERFTKALQTELDQVLILGSMVELSIKQSIIALQRHDQIIAKRIIDGDLRINEKRYLIEQECISLIATQQPMARDIRFLAAILEIITELERIGDYAKGISKINMLLKDEIENPPIYHDLQRMADLGLGMLRRALDAFVNFDVEEARSIPLDDDQVDRLYIQIYMELLQTMMDDKTTIHRANHLIWAAHNLERMADRVTNICERIIYAGTGEMKELDVADMLRVS